MEEAVKKVLLGGGLGGLDPAKLLGSVDTAAVVSRIKEERQDSDEDVCIIEDTEAVTKVEAAAAPVSPSKPKLYLPPANCPQYNPTPIKELAKRANIPPSLVQASSLAKPKSSLEARIRAPSKKTFSYNPPPDSGAGVLGDIGDLSESDTEQDTPDLLGNFFLVVHIILTILVPFQGIFYVMETTQEFSRVE